MPNFDTCMKCSFLPLLGIAQRPLECCDVLNFDTYMKGKICVILLQIDMCIRGHMLSRFKNSNNILLNTKERHKICYYCTSLFETQLLNNVLYSLLGHGAMCKLPHSAAPHTTAASTAKLLTVHLAWQPFSCWELLEWSIT